MGHKVNPFSWRLYNNKNWPARWFGKNNFANAISEDLQIRDAIAKKYNKAAGVKLVEIMRDHDSITINLHTSKPGVIIGRSGQGIVDLRANLIKNVTSFRQLPVNKQPKIRIEIIEIRNPEVHAQLIAESIAQQIEKRIMNKRAIKQAIDWA